jgi:hypothetical protein
VLCCCPLTGGGGGPAASGHPGLVETLAERIAAMVLATPRAAGMGVGMQQPATGSGIVGVGTGRSGGAAAGAAGM